MGKHAHKIAVVVFLAIALVYSILRAEDSRNYIAPPTGVNAEVVE